MRKTLLHLIAVLGIGLWSTVAFAQSQNNLLSIPPKYYKPAFGTVHDLPTQWPGYFVGSTYVWGYDGQPAQHNHNAMQDAQGNLLFFMVDNYVYDKKGYYINTISSAQEICVVPDPGNCQRYYLFYSSQGQYPQPYYSILDLSIPHTNTGVTGTNGGFCTGGRANNDSDCSNDSKLLFMV